MSILSQAQTLTTEELAAVKADLEYLLEQRFIDARRDALEKIHAIAAGVGCSVEELIALAPKRPVKKGLPKYRNPDNPTQTWTGKGTRPRWYVSAQLRGLTPDQMLIPRDA